MPHNFKVLEVLEIVKATMLRLSLSAATPYGEQLVREVVTKLIRPLAMRRIGGMGLW